MKQNHTRKEVTRRKNTQSVKNQKAGFPEAIGLAPCLGRSDQPCFSHRARSCPGLGSDTWLEVTSAFPPLLRRLGANILLPGPLGAPVAGSGVWRCPATEQASPRERLTPEWAGS